MANKIDSMQKSFLNEQKPIIAAKQNSKSAKSCNKVVKIQNTIFASLRMLQQKTTS